jgi:hypothetical protein
VLAASQLITKYTYLGKVSSQLNAAALSGVVLLLTARRRVIDGSGFPSPRDPMIKAVA